MQQLLQHRQQGPARQENEHPQNAHILNSEILEKRLVAHMSELTSREEHFSTLPSTSRANVKRSANSREDDTMTISSFSIAVTPNRISEGSKRALANTDEGGGKKPVRLSSASINNMDVPSLGQSRINKNGSGSDNESDYDNDESDWSGEWDEDGVLHRRHQRVHRKDREGLTLE